MNNEELLKEFDRRQKELRDEFIAKLKNNKKEFELSYPANNSTVYYVDSCQNNIDCTAYYESDNHDINKFETGFYFKTKAEAERSRKERSLLVKLRQFAEMKNDGWRPNWEDDEYKFYLWYDSQYNELEAGNTRFSNRFNGLPYFRSDEIAKECIDLFGDEILEVFINKNSEENNDE